MAVDIVQGKDIEDAERVPFRFKEIAAVLFVASSGFFVDVYDIVLFSVLRVPSLLALGISKQETLTTGVLLLNMQLLGMVIGGFFWGTLGDRKGRKASLFGSIFLYSLATLLNGFVHTLPEYAFLRFVAGLGLAGEVGAALTIAAEVAPAKHRGYATAIVRACGSAGGVLACILGARLPWRTAYISAGVVGFVLLLGRMSITESKIFVRLLEDKEVKLGSIKLFLNKDRFFRLLRCVLAVVPFWFVFGILISFAPEISGAAKGTAGAVTVAAAGLYFSIGSVFGELLSGSLSQWLHSRKKAIFIFLAASLAIITILFLSPSQYYSMLCLPLGILIAYNVVVNTTTTEQFGTNLRATATTLAPNFVRASAIPITLLFSGLATTYGALNAAMISGALCFTLAVISIFPMEETFAKELDFVER